MPENDLNSRIKVDVIASDDAVRESTRMLLEMHDYSGRDYTSGLEYILGSAARPYCVLTSRELPDMSGLDLIEHLRTCGETTPAIMILERIDQQMASRAALLSLKLLETPATADRLLGSILDCCFEHVTRENAERNQNVGGSFASADPFASECEHAGTSFSNWSNKANVGIATFDTEHANLFEMVVDIYDAALTGEPHLSQRNLFEKLLNYTSAHFAHEEKYMRFTDYPERLRHTEAHRRLEKSVVKRLIITDGSRTKRAEFALETVRYLRRWLMDHIFNEDRALGAFLNTKNLR